MPPQVTGVSPNTGSANGGDAVTIVGSGFTGAVAVIFGNREATNVELVSDTQITCISPVGSGTVRVTVTSAADQFTYTAIASPQVTRLSPASGTGGDVVTITGSGFTGATLVSFGESAAAGVTVESDTQITCVSPAGGGTVDVTVTTPAGTSPTSAADQWTYV